MTGVRGRDALDFSDAEAHAGRRVGVCDHDRSAEAKIVLRRDAEILAQRDAQRLEIQERREHRVKAVADVREGDPVVAKGHEGQIQHLVGAVSKQDLLLPHPAALRQLPAKKPPVRVGIELQPPALGVHRVQDRLRRRKGGLVGVELDILLILRLLARHIGPERRKAFTEKAAHCSNLISTLRAWPSSSSLRAKSAICSDTPRSASFV